MRKRKQDSKLIIALEWMCGIALGVALISTTWACFVYRDRNGSFFPNQMNSKISSSPSSSSDSLLPAATPIPDGSNLQMDPNATSETPVPKQSQVDPLKNVSVAGFKTLHIAADTPNVTVDFYNPSKNENEFLMTFELLLPTADGLQESVYSSGLVEAGDHITAITLSHPVARGVYEKCVLRIQPYFVADRSPANTAEVVFTLYAE